ncbi:hypothetical protein NRB16_24465 [Pseudomonas sp. LJDD11]|uniref:phage tail fiber protein n=1 Tax=unclassified Pseudomonas TaxID=196821 RepID=UPI002098305A|nr:MULTISPECIES: hypothetical protein [unclassified Pseudomonas]MCO8160978.1 hypothetical protein [Pseudomonas sp. 21LCFQ010]MCQ9426678.1 hypothetical protein [Pseudomonas sp. LJDD11]
MYDISATGLSLTIIAHKTFPNGFPVTEFADDADPFDLPTVVAATAAMNVNGDLVVFSSPQPILPTLNVIPGSEADNNLQILFEANRAAKGKKVAGDVVKIVASYPDGSTLTVSNGKILSGNPGNSVASAGRKKSKAYAFAFQDLSSTRPTAE